MYSKALRYVVSRSVDVADIQFLIGSKKFTINFEGHKFVDHGF